MKAVFIDRDGVINKKLNHDYVKEWDEFEFLPGAREGVQLMKDSGFITVVVTNQRCIARGVSTIEKLTEIHARMMGEFLRSGGSIDAVYFCPHDVHEGCACRKPEPGMVLKAVKDFESRGVAIDVENSFFVGDEEKDMLAGKAAGLRTIKIGEGHPLADEQAGSLFDAARLICS
ncbi:MAG: hypothetical protein A2V21_304580 [Deltaproteobacteria bacterium GWC2_55_46]|nr:MAG: hypothetical protein A2Z79_08385 [Deltaproteobacteria bacterium GWA2_55_82]OGQ63160.1 MAG: hypothetical protein A3I81_10015 [Deltaproteobacteria bacterium RIFCSPLOWO2_02_FULL_55_12]OIJ75049.1 MAG: hypothetical protein A2V21_304580 [Deltaproteobacteria bacterium GWC2_55_46]